jgi:hypothetical protein
MDNQASARVIAELLDEIERLKADTTSPVQYPEEKIVIAYWSIRGLGQACRVLLHYTGNYVFLLQHIPVSDGDLLVVMCRPRLPG